MTAKSYADLTEAALSKTRGLGRDGWYAPGVLEPREAAAALLESFFGQTVRNGPGGYVGNGYAFQPGPGGGAAHRIAAGLLLAGRGHDADLADASLDVLRLFSGCRDEDDLDRLSERVDEDAAAEAFCEAFEQGRVSAFLDRVLAGLPEDADLSALGIDLDRSSLPLMAEPDAGAPPHHPGITVKVAGKKPLAMIEAVQKALVKAGLGESTGYRFRGEAASGKEPVEDVVRRWVGTDLPPAQADEPESGPAPR